MTLPDRACALLDVWFAGTDGSSFDMEGPTVRRWFAVDPAFDAELRAAFGDDLEQAARGELGAWCASPRGTLALIVLCDQIPRNVHRGTPRAFATDPMALHTTLLGLARGDHAGLTVPERLFFLMPLMHSESLAIHDVARQEFAAVVAEAERSAPSTLGYAKGALDYEDKHRVILERFGRYPHRNTILGRTSTAEELEFLQQPGSSF